jgi:tRNA pseudouridine38-40 synthase
VDERFHSRYDAKAREYRYYIDTALFCLPNRRLYCYPLKRMPVIGRLNRYAEQIVGTYDFSGFALPSDESGSKVRSIFSACFYPENGFIVFRIAGSGFLWRMVRIIVGTFLSMESENADECLVSEILKSKKRDLVADSAPAQGLFLHKVYYDEQRLPF